MDFLADLAADLDERTRALAPVVPGRPGAGPSRPRASVPERSRGVAWWGQGLRYLLSLELLAAGELTVAELVQRIEAGGDEVEGRASKVVSDALRWEVAHGRVVRVGRGRYRTGRIPRTTVTWMRRRVAAARAAWMPPADGAPRPLRPRQTPGVGPGTSIRAVLRRRARATEARLEVFRRWAGADVGLQPLVGAGG